MSYRLQEYFDDTPIVRMTRGSQSTVYEAGHLVLKDQSCGRIRQWIREKTLKASGHNRTFSAEACRSGLRTLGKLAIPYTMPESIRANVVSKKGKVLGVREFTDPIVQVKTRPGGQLRNRLMLAIKLNDAEEIRKLLKDFLDLYENLAVLDYFVIDMLSSNVAYDPDERLRIQDMGALLYTMDDRFPRAKKAENSTYATAVAGMRSALRFAAIKNREIADILEEFEVRLDKIWFKKPVNSKSKRKDLKQRVPGDLWKINWLEAEDDVEAAVA